MKSADGKYIPRDFNVSDPNYNQSWRERTMIGYELEHQFADNLTFRQNARYATIGRNIIIWFTPTARPTARC